MVYLFIIIEKVLDVSRHLYSIYFIYLIMIINIIIEISMLIRYYMCKDMCQDNSMLSLG